MQRHWFAISLSIISITESTLILLHGGLEPGITGRNVEFLLVAYLPILIWFGLHLVAQLKWLRIWIFAAWSLSTILGVLTARMWLRNELAGLLWYGFQFWWGLIGAILLALVMVSNANRKARTLGP